MKILNTLLKISIKTFSFIYNHDRSIQLKRIWCVLYSCWIKNSINECGEGLHVQLPVYLKGGRYITIGKNFESREQLRIECWDEYRSQKFIPRLTIGNNVNVNFNLHIDCVNEVVIGNNVLFASDILIIDHQHGQIDFSDLGIIPSERLLTSKGPVIIGDNVWIGEKVVIMPNVTIGEGSIIGANSVVTKSFPKNSVIGGIPARFIKSLDIDYKKNG